jgi:RNA polymerase sigma-70 factor, ECF subfamily
LGFNVMNGRGGGHFDRKASADVATAEFADVLEAARQGSHQAIAVLWRELHPRLLLFLRGLDPVAAEDVEAETWFVAARDLADFDGDERQFRAWMFTIARNRLIDWRRYEARRPGVAVTPEALDRPADDDPAATALDAVGAEAAIALVRACLPPDQAEVILLRVVGGLQAAEVAAIVGKRSGTVCVLQHRGLRQLADQITRGEVERRGVTE